MPKSCESPSTRFPGPVALRLIVLLLTGILTACGSDGDAETTTTTGEPGTTSTSTTAAPATTTASGTQEEVFGWLRSFESDGAATIVGIDEAEMFTGEDALAAAREDGAIGAGEELDNDFYIRNLDDSTRDLSVSPGVAVTLQACYPAGECVTTETVDLATWSVLLGGEEDPGLDWDWYGSGALPNVFTVLNGVVVEVLEVYLP